MHNGALKITPKVIVTNPDWGGELSSLIIDPRKYDFQGAPEHNQEFVGELNKLFTLEEIAGLLKLKPFHVTKDIIEGREETLLMPSNNPNKIGLVQIIDSQNENETYNLDLNLASDGRSATFYSPITLNNASIWIWPKE